MTSTTYRHELKYLCTDAQLALVENRIQALMKKDAHVGEKGIYTIRSLYFDDYRNSCYYENENGTDPREKFRIRIYNHNLEHIKLERKRKERGKTKKDACNLTAELCTKIIKGEFVGQDAVNHEVYRKFWMLTRTQMFRPKVIVEYDRVPYVCGDGNVRITLDKNIRAGNQCRSFMEPMIATRLIMPKGQQVLEVKYDAYLPDYIYQGTQIESLQQTAFSKYYLCRKYNLGGAYQ